jgi:hypothetical protein
MERSSQKFIVSTQHSTVHSLQLAIIVLTNDLYSYNDVLYVQMNSGKTTEPIWNSLKVIIWTHNLLALGSKP